VLESLITKDENKSFSLADNQSEAVGSLWTRKIVAKVLDFKN